MLHGIEDLMVEDMCLKIGPHNRKSLNRAENLGLGGMVQEWRFPATTPKNYQQKINIFSESI